MGGAPCIIVIHAILRFQEIPKEPAALLAFDEQMRQCIQHPLIAQSISDDTDDAKEVWDIMKKATWDATDRKKLFGILSEYGKF